MGEAGAARLRLGLISYRLPVAGAKRGGIERVAHDLATGLARRGHTVTVWSYDEAPSDVAYQVRPLPFRGFAESWLGHRVTLGYLGNLFSALPDYAGQDAVIAMGDSLLLPLRGRPVVRVMCGSALGEALSATTPWRFAMQMGVYAQELLGAALQRATVGISENTRRYNPFVRRTIPIGVALNEFGPAEEERSRTPLVLFVGALAGRKRGRLLLEWFVERVKPRHPDAELVMVSSPGPTVQGVRYATGISTAELAGLYRQAWVYASPSTYEGFGLPYVEAMASGTPVLASPNPGSREVLADGRYGLIAKDDEFADVLERLLNDRELRTALGQRGLERAQEYAMENVIDGYEDLLREVCRPPNGDRHRWRHS